MKGGSGRRGARRQSRISIFPPTWYDKAREYREKMLKTPSVDDEAPRPSYLDGKER